MKGMKITDKNLNTIQACRYCPMCRQSCPSEFINYKESDTPRGRAILLYNVYQGDRPFEVSTIESIYNCFLCGACKSWCSGHELGGYDIPELVKSARRDIVSQGLAPHAVQEIMNSLIENDNTQKINKKLSYTASITEQKAEVLYLLGEGVNYNSPEIAKALIGVLDKIDVSYTLLKEEPTSGKEFDLLGYKNEAKEKAKVMFARIKSTSCKTIVVSDPLVYDVLKNDYPAWELGLDQEVLHISEYLLKLVHSGELKLKSTQTKITLVDSEYLGRYSDIYEAPREIIKTSAGKNFSEMYWNHEYLQSAGEAAIVFNGSLFKQGKALGRKISQKAEDINAETIVTLSATAKSNISETTKLKVLDIAEFVHENIG